jgi:hypothetical protein
MLGRINFNHSVSGQILMPNRLHIKISKAKIPDKPTCVSYDTAEEQRVWGREGDGVRWGINKNEHMIHEFRNHSSIGHNKGVCYSVSTTRKCR